MTSRATVESYIVARDVSKRYMCVFPSRFWNAINIAGYLHVYIRRVWWVTLECGHDFWHTLLSAVFVVIVDDRDHERST